MSSVEADSIMATLTELQRTSCAQNIANKLEHLEKSFKSIMDSANNLRKIKDALESNAQVVAMMGGDQSHCGFIKNVEERARKIKSEINNKIKDMNKTDCTFFRGNFERFVASELEERIREKGWEALEASALKCNAEQVMSKVMAWSDEFLPNFGDLTPEKWIALTLDSISSVKDILIKNDDTEIDKLQEYMEDKRKRKKSKQHTAALRMVHLEGVAARSQRDAAQFKRENEQLREELKKREALCVAHEQEKQNLKQNLKRTLDEAFGGNNG